MNVPETFFTVHEELMLFFMSCAAGAVLGIFYDVFRALRLLVPHHSFFVVLEDIVFLGCYGIFLSAFASAQARGELRIYFILGNILGFALYYFTLGSVVIRIIGKLLEATKKLLNIIFKPFRLIYVIFREKAIDKFVGYSKNIVKRIKNHNTPLPKHDEMLYNNKE